MSDHKNLMECFNTTLSLARYEKERREIGQPVFTKSINITEKNFIINPTVFDVYDEHFLIPFYTMLEKFVNEFDDMSQMETIRLAKELLDEFNK